MLDLSASRTPRWFFTLLGSFLLAFAVAVPAQGQVAQSSALFLRIEPDSRSAGMGNAGVALADNANAIFWNPAGIAFQEDTEFGFTHANWLPEFDANLFHEYLTGTYHVEGIGTFGGNVRYLNLGEIEVRGTDGEVLNVVSSYQLAVGTSYGVKVSDRLGLGTSLRFIYSKLAKAPGQGGGNGKASTFATDLSALYRSAPFPVGGTDVTFSAGLNISNLGGTLDFNKDRPGKDPIPASFRIGPALTLEFDEYNSLTLATDFNKSLVSVDVENDSVRVGNTGFEALFDSWGTAPGQVGPEGEPTKLTLLQQFTVGTGLEYWYSDLFALRTGYYYEHPDNGNRQFLTFGAGLRYNIVGVDFSYLYTADDASPLANTLRISALVELN